MTVQLQPPVTSVFFDFDGVICDSVNVKTEAFDRLYRDYDDDIRRMVREYHLHHGGISRYEKIRHYEAVIQGRPADEKAIEKKAGQFAELVVDAVVDSPFIAGAEQALERLKGVCPLFVVSGTPQDELRTIVERRRLSGIFDGVYGSPATKSAILEVLLTENDLDRRSAAMIGDAITDFDAAMDNEVPFVGVVGAGHPSPFPPGTLIIEDLTMLPEILTGSVADKKL
ncbi:MAG: HAD hydrolase-like protein [Rhodospirillales bacterium]